MPLHLHVSLLLMLLSSSFFFSLFFSPCRGGDPITRLAEVLVATANETMAKGVGRRVAGQLQRSTWLMSLWPRVLADESLNSFDEVHGRRVRG